MSEQEFTSALIENRDYLQPFAFGFTRDTEKAKDLVQETMHRALLNKSKFNAGTNFKAWTYTIMRNIFINDFRKNSRYTIVHDNSEQGTYMDSLKSVQNTAESSIGYKELHKLVSKLPEIFKTPFVMYYHGYHYKEIAAKLALPLGTIKSRIHFSRRMLKDQILAFNI